MLHEPSNRLFKMPVRAFLLLLALLWGIPAIADDGAADPQKKTDRKADALVPQ